MNTDKLERSRSLAKALDAAIQIPGTHIRVGLDALLGLIPGGGDVAAAALWLASVLSAVRAGVPQPVIWRMLANIGIDTVLGSVPVIGDLFDVGFKSNMRNVALMERYANQPATVEKRSRWLGIAVIVAIAVLLFSVLAAGFFAARLIWHALAS